VLVSVAPHNTLKPVPAVVVFIAGGVVIVPPAAFIEMITLEVANSLVFEMVIVPPDVQVKVLFLAEATFTAPLSETVNLATPPTPDQIR
jgi:hypothetical protein